jgi:hypothetical protein
VQRLYKSRKDKVLDGVCSGIGEYFDVDTAIIPREPDQKRSSSNHDKSYDNDTQNEISFHYY